MGSVTPVTYRASSEASHSTALEMSTGSTHGIGSAFSVWNRLAQDFLGALVHGQVRAEQLVGRGVLDHVGVHRWSGARC